MKEMTEKELLKRMDRIRTWQQGRYVPFGRKKHSPKFIENAKRIEALLVRPDVRQNAICRADSPESAIWIAERLNLCSVLEQQNAKLREALSESSDLLVSQKMDLVNFRARETKLRELVETCISEINYSNDLYGESFLVFTVDEIKKQLKEREA